MYACDCSFCMLPHSLLVHFSSGRVVTTANNIRHLIVTSSVVIIVHTLTYHVCANIKLRDNNIHKCAPFTKFTKMIGHKYFQRTVYIKAVTAMNFEFRARQSRTT